MLYSPSESLLSLSYSLIMLRALLALACAFTIKFAIGHFSSPSLDYTLAATDAIPAAALLLTVSLTSLITCVPSTAVSLISLKLLLTSKAVYSNLFTIDPKKVGLLVFGSSKSLNSSSEGRLSLAIDSAASL